MEATGIAKDLGHGAAQIRALKGVNLSLRGGELTLLMGPSGSGKTTLLSILGCMLTPTEGTVRVRGDSIAGKNPRIWPSSGARTSASCSSPIICFRRCRPPTTCGWRSTCAARPARPRRTNRRAALARVGLSNKTRNYPRQLSGGEQQRVAIARAVVGDPSVILADEPTAALDSENGKAIMSILAEIAKDPGRGVLVVTHDPRLVPYADRIVHIEDGNIVREESGGAARKS